ncbi:lipopolysaccharide biosynthesis protein [Bacillus sp. UMB0893]|uniref:lipopolysaccharide biosynthesis protein n=1 Tax=Bacillus sp. UMB0893 TaxID=2066053 RepID=UPI000C7721F7|nr:flippase [Bacillus sp. UMB0893]PLR67930.1 polysaccharide biosynthesis protein [Bacillus sp. UMB0893]
MIKKKISSNSLFSSASIYVITQIINASIPFLLLPIITRYLSPEEFGIYSMFKVIAGLAFSFIGIGINGAITKIYYEKKKDELATYIANSFFLVTINSIFMFIIFGAFPGFISSASQIPQSWLWSVILVSYGKVLFQVTLVIWQVQNNPFKYAVFQIVQTIVNFALNLWFVMALYLNWQGAILAETLAFMIFGIIGLGTLYKNGWVNFKLNLEDLRHLLKFGAPLIPHAIGMYIITASDRILITNMVGVAETGLYSVGYQIGMIIMILQDSFNKAWVPWLFSNLKNNKQDVEVKIVKFTYFYFVVIIAAALLLALIAPWLISVMAGPEYQSSYQFVIWLAIGYAFNGMYKMVTNYIFYVGKTHYLATVTFLTAIINLVLSYFFIKIWGAVGAAQATAISYLISFILTWYIANKVYKMPWLLSKNKFRENI